MPDEPESDIRTFLPITRILCPIDFSDWSRAAVERAMALAWPTRAEITGVFVLPLATPPAVEPASCPCAAEAEEAMIAAVAEDVEEFLAPARRAGLRTRACVERGDPVARIVERARETEADVIVMGTHGRSSVERWVLGSVLDGVMRQAPCPVLAVTRRLGDSRPPAPGAGGILCAVSLSARSACTLSYAVELGRSTGSAVTALHVSDEVGPGAGPILDREHRKRLHAVVPAERPCAEVVLAGEAPQQILSRAEMEPPALIVVGSDGSGIGPTVRRVIREARSPVLVVPFPAGGRRP
jgi:nucleotide-binding universal stress UspA family protein